MLVDEVMTREVITLRSRQSISDAVNKLAEHGISGAPVLDDEDELVGIITEKDILNALKLKNTRLEMVYPSLSMVSVAFVEKMDKKETLEAFSDIANSKVSDLMTKSVVTVQTGADLALVVDFIIAKEVNRVPVMDGTKLIGIVSRADIMKGLAKSKILK